jgi:5-methyltetrahydrofolate--homocysteine methyltransferase
MEWAQLAEALYAGRVDEVASLTRQALAEGREAREVLNDALLPGMEKVGNDFREEILFLPEVLLTAKAMHAAMDVLKPLLTEAGGPGLGTLVMGTVRGDIHDIGKNLVIMMMRGAGIEVIDLGIDVAPETFVEAVREYSPPILGMSALLTTTVEQMGMTIQALEKAGLTDRAKIMVGGAPVTRQFAERIGADGYAPDAIGAVDLARAWLNG